MGSKLLHHSTIRQLEVSQPLMLEEFNNQLHNHKLLRVIPILFSYQELNLQLLSSQESNQLKERSMNLEIEFKWIGRLEDHSRKLLLKIMHKQQVAV